MLTISTVIGPVSYPIITSTMKRHDVKIYFDEREADVYLNAVPALGKVDYFLVSKMLLITPKLGNKIAVWKKGSANDLLLQLLFKLYSLNPEVVYVDNPNEVYKLYSSGVVDSAMVTVGMASEGLYVEDLFRNKGFDLPGICGAKVIRNGDDFESAYQEGIDLFKENPEEVSEYVMDNLPIMRPSTFIRKIMETAVYEVKRTSFDFEAFKERVLSSVNETPFNDKGRD